MKTAERSDVRPAAPVDTRRRRIVACVALVTLATSTYFIWRHFQRPGISYETVADRPLLKRPWKEFRDEQSGLRFTPPPKWSLQLISQEAPDERRSERTLVKYKRLLPGVSPAAFRVVVVDASKDEEVVDAVQKRDPGAGWAKKGNVETLTVGGLAAAKIQYFGSYAGVPSFRDIVGVRREKQMFYFISTYQFADRAAQEETRQVMNSVLFQDP